jgi:hypothetical protein
MKRTRILGMCLVAVFALTAVLASVSQAATPVFYTKAAIGTTAANQQFTSSSAASYLEGASSHVKIECKKSTGTGEVTGAKSVNKVVTTFKECEIPSLHFPCENKGAGTHEIETLPNAGELGEYTSSEGGVKLTAESGIYLAEFQCAGGGVLIKSKGSLVGKIKGSANTVQESKFTPTLSLTFQQTGGIQKIKNLIGGSPEQLTSVVSEFNGTEYVTHEELGGQNQTAKLADANFPADSNIGVTK